MSYSSARGHNDLDDGRTGGLPFQKALALLPIPRRLDRLGNTGRRRRHHRCLHCWCCATGRPARVLRLGLAGRWHRRQTALGSHAVRAAAPVTWRYHGELPIMLCLLCLLRVLRLLCLLGWLTRLSRRCRGWWRRPSSLLGFDHCRGTCRRNCGRGGGTYSRGVDGIRCRGGGCHHCCGTLHCDSLCWCRISVSVSGVWTQNRL